MKLSLRSSQITCSNQLFRKVEQNSNLLIWVNTGVSPRKPLFAPHGGKAPVNPHFVLFFKRGLVQIRCGGLTGVYPREKWIFKSEGGNIHYTPKYQYFLLMPTLI